MSLLTLLALALNAACAPVDEGECRAWCEFTIAEHHGEESVEAVCGTVPEVLDGCGRCMDTWGETAVRDANVSPACCVLGVGSLSPEDACQVHGEQWESEQAAWEEGCRTEGAEFGYEHCVD